MNIPVEPKPGETFSAEIETVEYAEQDKTAKRCPRCIFYHHESCPVMPCSTPLREDGKMVYFRLAKQEFKQQQEMPHLGTIEPKNVIHLPTEQEMFDKILNPPVHPPTMPLSWGEIKIMFNQEQQTPESVIEDLQEALIQVKGNFIRQIGVKEMKVWDLLQQLIPNGVVFGISHKEQK